MELKPGYKQTEVGVIPEDWDVQTMATLAKITTGPFGTLLKASEYSADGSGVPLVSVGEVRDGYIKITEHTPRVPPTVIRRLPQYVLRAGDIVFGRKGAVDRSALITKKEEGYFLGSDGISVRLSGSCSPIYASCQLRSHRIRSWLLQNAIGTTMASLNQGILKKIPLSLPPPPEQEAIASALSDIDDLIESLDELISKKQGIKQAAMQELLTGKRRLPGFEGEWEMKRLGDVLSICHGKSQRDVEVTNGPYPILATGGQIGTAERPLYSRPSVLIGRKGTINKPQYMDTPFWTVDTLFYSEMKELNSARFFYYLFCTIDWMQFNEASGVPSLNAKTIETIEVGCPTTQEQDAIASVLSELDAELAALVARKVKAQQLKQGMMQQLLTGKIRLT
jgi:type I restriction enzyme S subunit